MDKTTIEERRAQIKKRYKAERRFQAYGIAAVGFGLLCVVLLFTDIISKGVGAFRQTYVQMDMTFDVDTLGIVDVNDPKQLAEANYGGAVKKSLRAAYPEYKTRKEKKSIYGLVSSEIGLILRKQLRDDPSLLGTTTTQWLLADDDIDTHYKHAFGTDEQVGRINDLQKSIVDELHEQGRIETRFNWPFFQQADSREPELAGIKGAVVGLSLIHI